MNCKKAAIKRLSLGKIWELLQYLYFDLHGRYNQTVSVVGLKLLHKRNQTGVDISNLINATALPLKSPLE